MFEGWIYQLVAGYLGNYIKDIQREQFRIGLWSGVALVENAELRLEAFDYLQLPFAIKQGFVGKLRLQIPWKTLFWEPILIALEDVYICAYPREESEFDADASENRAMAAKKAQLAAAEITKLSSHVPDEKVRYSFLSHLLAKFIANIQVTVRNIHIRYINGKVEDKYDFGIKLMGLTVTDVKGASAPVVKSKSGLVHKSVEINQFAFYWNSGSSSLPASSSVGNFLTRWFMKKEEDLTYILKPMDVSSKLTVNRSAASAQYSLNTTVEKLDVTLADRQVYEMFLLWDSMKVAKLRERYGRFRPDVNPSASLEWQRSWWQYAIKSVCSDVQRRLRRTSWRYLAWRLDCRRRYVSLYMKKLECFQEGKPPASDIIKDLEELERELDMDMILLFRSIAEEKCHFDGSGRDEIDTNKKNSSEDHRPRHSRGWLNLLSFGMFGGSGGMDTAAEITGPLSNELMKDLYEATKFHPAAVSNGEYNLVALSLQVGQVVTGLETSTTNERLVEVTLQGVSASFKRMHSLAAAAVAVKRLEVTDVCTESTYFKHIVQPKGMNSRYSSSKHKSYAEAVYAANSPSLFQIGISQRELNEAVFCADIEMSDDPNMKVVVVVKPLEIVYSTRIVRGLLRFMRPPTLHEIDEGLETLDVFQVPRNVRTWMKLMVTVDVRHPVLLIPESVTTTDCAVLVVHLDSVHLAVTQLYSSDLSKKDSELSKNVKARFSKLTLDSPLPSAALQHLEIKAAGLQVGVAKGSADLPLLTTLFDHFDIQLNVVKYQTSLGSHWKVEGSAGDISMSLSPADYRILKSVLHTSSDTSVQPEDSLGDFRWSQPSNLASNMVSGGFTVASASLRLSPDAASSTAFKVELTEFEFKILNNAERRDIRVTLGKVCVENVELPSDCPHRFLLKETASGAAVFTLIYTRIHQVGSSSQFLLHLRKTQCGLYPKAVAAVASFFHAEDGLVGLESASDDTNGISCSIELEDISLSLCEDNGTLAMLNFPRAAFSLSSDIRLETWQLEGTATDLQLKGPNFSTQGLVGMPFGCLVDGRHSNINLRLVKDPGLLDIVISLQSVECILLSDYLALLIGFFRSPDWSFGPQTSLPARERVRPAVQYEVQVRESLLLLPIGGGCFGKILIPGFHFAFIPADVSGDFPTFFSRSYPGSKVFYVMGKQLSLSFYGLNSEAEEERRCLPLIDRLDGDILIEVPGAAISTRIDLRFREIALMLVGDRFLKQIKWVEIISTDLATLGTRALYAKRIWECLSNGNNFVLESCKENGGAPSLDLQCSIDEIRLSVASFKRGKAEIILVNQANTLSSTCALRAGELESFGVKLAGMKLMDGGHSSVTLDSFPRTPAFEADMLAPVQGRTLVLSGSDGRPVSATLSAKTVDIVLPSVEVWLHLSSWSPLISWVFFCFPVVPPASQDDGTVTPVSEDAVQVLDHLTPQMRIQVQVPHLGMFFPAFTALPEEERKFISFTTCFYVDKLEFAETKCNLSAHLSQFKAELNEGKGSTYCFILGGDVQVEVVLEVGKRVILTSIISIASVDCWCSYPVLQFLNAFELEPSPEEEDSVVVDIEHVLEVRIATCSLLLTDGRWNYNCPLLEVILGNTCADISVCLRSGRMVLSTLLEVSYHNIEKAVWEPFLEPWSVSCALSRGYGGLRTKLEVMSMDSLNINVTEGLAQAASRALEMISWTKNRFQYLNGDIDGRKLFFHYAPYWFQNDTGVAVWYSIIWPSQNECTSDCTMLTSGTWNIVLPGCSVPLFVEENEGFIQHRRARWSTARVSERKKFSVMLHRRICVRLEGSASASLPMSIDLVGCRAFEVAFSKVEETEGNRHGMKSDLAQQNHSHVFATHALFEVSLQHHSKLIRLRSTVCLANMTSLLLEVRLEIPFGIAPKIMDPISPNDIVPLPVHLAETARVRLRPYGKHFLWSEPHALSKMLSRDQKQSIQRPVVCYPPKPNHAPFRCCISVEEKTASVLDPDRWKMWNVVLKAPFMVKNCFPCILNVDIESSAGLNLHSSVPKGDCVSFYEVDIVNDLNLKFSVSGFLPSSLKFGRPNGQNKSETGEVLVFNPENSSGRPIYARADKIIDLVSGRREITISVPYWIYNCSGLDLAFLDADMGLHTGEEQILPNAYGKASCAPVGGLKALLDMTSGFNGCLQHQPGKLISHIPSCKLCKPAPVLSASADDTENDIYLQPHLYSPAQGAEVNEHKMRLRVLHSCPASWSQPFQLEPPGGTSPIVLPQPDSGGAYVLCISSMPALGACSGKTKTITFRPRFILANASRQDICFKQQGTDVVKHLPVGQNVHVHWTDTSRNLLLSVRYNEHGWDWSGGFSMDQLGDTQVKVHNHCSGSKEILRVEVSNPDAEGMNSGNKSLGTFFIILTNDETGFLPYRIDNFTPGRLRFYQKRCDEIENVLQPYSSCDYAWDEPCLPRLLVLEIPGGGPLGAYELETVKSYPPIQLHFSGQKTERRFLVSVHAEGARRVLTVIDLNLHTEKDSRTSLSMGETTVVSASEDFSLQLSSVSVSLVDAVPQEVALASARGVQLQLLQNDFYQNANLEIAGLQVDNQLRHATYPVMLSAANAASKPWGIPDRRLEQQATEKPAVVLKVSKWRHRTGSVDCFQCIYLSVAPLRLELEERNLARLVGLLRSLSAGGPNMRTETSTSFKVLQHSSGSGSFTNLSFIEIAEVSETCKSWPDPAAVEPVKSPTRKLIASAKQRRKAYIEAFCIEPLELTISFSSIPWLPKETRESILWVTGSLLQRRLIALADVEGAPIRLRQLTLAHPMANWNAILGIAQRHYTRQLLHEVYKVLGSADVFGNPMGFMRSLASGMWDFVSAPARSIRQNPVHVVQGVRVGTQSLFRNTIFAFSNAATQMSKAARKGVAVLALDQDYLNEHDIHQYGRDSNIVNEFLEGLTGLLQSSVRGAERHGIPGAFSGMALGMLRAVARPAASMLEVAGKTAQSIRNSSRPAQPRVARFRLPRYLEPGWPLLPYLANEAVGMAVLLEAESGRLKEEAYVTCQPLAEDALYVLLTENLLVQVKWTGREEQDTDWSIVGKHRVEDILYMHRDGTGTRLEVLLCTPNMFLTRSFTGSVATPSLAAAPSFSSNASSTSGSSSQHKGVIIKAGVVSSPFKNVTLVFGSSEAAEEFHSALLYVLGRKQSVKPSRGQQ